jgi:hypothetical protein
MWAMKKKDIKVGKTYTDNKGSIRLVVDEGPEFTLGSKWQTDKDCLRYRLLRKKRGPGKVGEGYNTTRTSFARWAKREWKRP